MYTGKWTIELNYKDANKNVHLQYREFSMVTPYVIPALQNVAVDRLPDGTFLVSWSAQGVPETPPGSPTQGQLIFDYLVYIFDLTPDNVNCADHRISGNWRGGTGWFDPGT